MRLVLSVPFMIARKSLSVAPHIMVVMVLNTMLILLGTRREHGKRANAHPHEPYLKSRRRGAEGPVTHNTLEVHALVGQESPARVDGPARVGGRVVDVRVAWACVVGVEASPVVGSQPRHVERFCGRHVGEGWHLRACASAVQWALRRLRKGGGGESHQCQCDPYNSEEGTKR